MLQALPREVKIMKTKQRIREAIAYFGVSGIYVPVSGGLDSTLLDYFVSEVQEEDGIPKKDIPRVNVNTRNEYPGVLTHARRLSDVEMVSLKAPYEVWGEEGYPVASKKTSRMIRDIQNPTSKNFNSRKLYLEGIKKDGTKGSSRCKLAKRWYPFIDETQEIKIKCSEKCCNIVKKEPMRRYEKKTGRKPILATMADEHGAREDGYLQTGCNAFDSGKSMPMGFWTKQDVLECYIEYKLEYPPEYGYIVRLDDGTLETTGEDRTGCFSCAMGVQMEKGENRFQRMKRLYPKMYNHCINGGFNDNGVWKPKKGLGLWFVLDRMGINYDGETGQIKGQISMFDLEK